MSSLLCVSTFWGFSSFHCVLLATAFTTWSQRKARSLTRTHTLTYSCTMAMSLFSKRPIHDSMLYCPIDSLAAHIRHWMCVQCTLYDVNESKWNESHLTLTALISDEEIVCVRFVFLGIFFFNVEANGWHGTNFPTLFLISTILFSSRISNSSIWRHHFSLSQIFHLIFSTFKVFLSIWWLKMAF